MAERFQQYQNSFIAHEPTMAEYGKNAGGAAGVALQHAMNLDRGRIISPEGKSEHPPSVAWALAPRPETRTNDELLQTLTNSDEYMEYFQRLLVDTGEANIAHYYVAGGIAAELGLGGEKNTDKPLLYMGHSWDRVVAQMAGERDITTTRNTAEIDILRESHGIVVSTPSERRMLALAYAQDIDGGSKAIFDKTHVIPLGVDHTVFNPDNMRQNRDRSRIDHLPAELADPENTVFYLLGRMSSQKGQLEAVQAVGNVLIQNPNLPISLSMIGGPLKGDYFREVVEYISTLPEHVQRRIITHDAIPGPVAHAMGDVFLGPSTWETWFLSLSEAMACGKPTAVTDMAILRDVGQEGTLFFNRQNPNQMADVVYNLAVNPAMRKDLAAINEQTARPYNWKQSGHLLQQAINGIRR